MRRAMVLLLLAMAVVSLAPPAAAQGTDDGEAVVVLTGEADVGPEEDLETVVIFDGPADIAGHVREQVVAFNGDVQVSGTVEDNVVALNGRVTVVQGGRVGGDVVSQRAAVVEPGATVEGDVRRFDRDVFDEWFGFVTRVAWWLAVTVSTLGLGLLVIWLAPRVVDATVSAGRSAPGPVVGWGLIALVGAPIAAGILMVTLVGIPLGLYLLATLGVVSVLGYTTTAWVLGRQMVREPRGRVLALLAGVAVLRALALVPILGGLLWVLAAVFGTGALVVAAWRARRGSSHSPASVPAQSVAAGEGGR